MTELTKVTNSVIQQNTVMGYNVQSNQIANRHYIDASIDISKLDETANVSAVQSNLTSAINNYEANDFATWNSAKANDYATLLAAYANDLVTYNQASVDFVNVIGDVMSGQLEIVRGTGDISLKLRENTGSNGIVFLTDASGSVYLIPIVDNVLQTANSLLHSTANTRWEFGTTPYVGGSEVIWHSGNDGPGSTLNADLLDGVEYTVIDANVYNTLLSAYSNDLSTYNQVTLDYRANDHSTWSVLNSNVDSVQSNLTALISGATEFTSAIKIFQGDVIVQGNVFVEGDTLNANVTNVTSEDTTIVVNWNGTDGSAEGAGLGVAGTSNDILANIIYATASASGFRIGSGTLTSADDIARRQDYQANDYTTLLSARANDFATWNSAKANDVVTILSARANDFATWNSAKANDFATWNSAKANDLATYNQALSVARANDFATWNSAKANDFNTWNSAKANDFVTWNSAKANDYVTILAAYANDFATWTGITANLDVVQDNVDSLSSTINAIPWTNSNTSTTSNVYFIGAPGTIENENSIYLSFGGVVQPETEWSFNSGNNTIQFNDASMPTGEPVVIQAFYKP